MVDVTVQEELERVNDMSSSRGAQKALDALTCSFANIAPKPYDGGIVCEPRLNECVTVNMGFMERLLESSALAPSNM